MDMQCHQISICCGRKSWMAAAQLPGVRAWSRETMILLLARGPQVTWNRRQAAGGSLQWGPWAGIWCQLEGADSQG